MLDNLYKGLLHKSKSYLYLTLRYYHELSYVALHKTIGEFIKRFID